MLPRLSSTKRPGRSSSSSAPRRQASVSCSSSQAADPQELLRRSCPDDELLASSVPAVTEDGIGWDHSDLRLWFSGETADRSTRAQAAAPHAAAARVERHERPPWRAARRGPDASRQLAAARADWRALVALAAESSSSRRRCASERPEVPRAWSSAPSCAGSAPRRSSSARTLRRAAAASPRSTSSSPAPTPRRRRPSAASRPPDAEGRAEGDDRLNWRRASSVRLERRREQLGQVNPLAKEEYEAEKERLEELAAQRADLERSLDELEKLRRELTETVERRFAETFEAVERHFDEVAATLFPGGEGRLRLTEPEDESEEPGIEVELRPAGKRVTRLAPLRRREGARRDRVPVLPLPRPTEPVLPPGRGRGRARRHEHRPLHEPAPPLRGPGAVHRDHPPEAHDGGGRRPLRRHDGPGRRLADRLAAAAARGGGRESPEGRPGNDLSVVPPGRVTAGGSRRARQVPRGRLAEGPVSCGRRAHRRSTSCIRRSRARSTGSSTGMSSPAPTALRLVKVSLYERRSSSATSGATDLLGRSTLRATPRRKRAPVASVRLARLPRAAPSTKRYRGYQAVSPLFLFLSRLSGRYCGWRAPPLRTRSPPSGKPWRRRRVYGRAKVLRLDGGRRSTSVTNCAVTREA